MTSRIDQRAEQHERERRDRKRAEQIEADLKFLMGTGQGRRYLMHLLESCGTLRNPFTGNGWTNYQCGRQSVGQDIFGALLKIDEDFLGKLRRDWQEMESKL